MKHRSFLSPLLLILFAILSFSTINCNGSFEGDKSEEETKASDAAGSESEANIISFSASPLEISSGEEVTLSWETSGGDKVTIEPILGEVESNGSQKIIVRSTTVFILKLYQAKKSEDGSEEIFEEVSSAEVPITVNATTDKGNNDDDDMPPSTDPCDPTNLNPQEIRSQFEFSVSSNSVTAGESVTVSWNVDLEDAIVTVSGDQLSSSDLRGQKDIVITQDSTFTIDVNWCQEEASQSQTVRVNHTSQLIKSDFNNVVEIFKGQNNTLWMSTADGKLYKTDNHAETWNLASGSRKSQTDLSSDIKNDNAPITSLLETNTECNKALFYASESGFIYRSQNAGQSLTNYHNEDLNLLYIDAIDFGPLTTHFIIKDPHDRERIYIGHDFGVFRINDCQDSSENDNHARDYCVYLDDDHCTEMMPFSRGQTQGATHAASIGEQLFVLSENKLFKRRSDNNWQEINLNGPVTWIKKNENRIYASGASGFWKYNGRTWNQYENLSYQDYFEMSQTEFSIQSGRLKRRPINQGTWTAISHEGSSLEKIYQLGPNKLGVVDKEGQLFELFINN